MTRRQWIRRMGASAAALLALGLALVIAGALAAGRSRDPMGGIAVGMLGVLFLTAGGLFGKFAIAGPYPRNLEPEPEPEGGA